VALRQFIEQILPGQASFTTQIESGPAFGQKKPQAKKQVRIVSK
jgi:hypothetical protein